MSSLDWDDRFNGDYFERGIEAGVSCYQNYRFMPEKSMRQARRLARWYPGKSFLDWGCAKGFLVQALRCLGVEAWGFDVSRYALEHVLPGVAECVYGPPKHAARKVDVVFSKDTLEHAEDLGEVLSAMREVCREAFVIVPLAVGGKYVIPDFEADVTHIQRLNTEQWARAFESAGFTVREFQFCVNSFKDKWVKINRRGNGFFRLNGR